MANIITALTNISQQYPRTRSEAIRSRTFFFLSCYIEERRAHFLLLHWQEVPHNLCVARRKRITMPSIDSVQHFYLIKSILRSSFFFIVYFNLSLYQILTKSRTPFIFIRICTMCTNK